MLKAPYFLPKNPPASNTANVPSVMGTGFIGIASCANTAVSAAKSAAKTCCLNLFLLSIWHLVFKMLLLYMSIVNLSTKLF